MDLYKLHQDSKLDYKIISSELFFKNKEENKVDISVIIPVRGRVQFQKPVLDHLFKSIQKPKGIGYTISVTYVEHSTLPTYLWKTPSGYIWIPCEENDRFNKCLCFNIGVLSGPKADYYLFHDSDLVCPENFFDEILNNISQAMQVFKGKRVLYANENLTQKFLSGSIYDNTLNDKNPDITIGVPGAPGGSIFVERDLFFKVGGYDAEYFTGYSIEDQFFFNKLSFFTEVKSLNTVDVIHLNHGTSHAKTENAQMEILKTFNSFSHKDKEDFFRFRSGLFKELL